jgi:nicotinamidase-related amidase
MSTLAEADPHAGGSVKVDLAREAFVLFVNLQEGISDLALTVQFRRLQASIRALARLAKLFQLPVIVSTVPRRGGGQAKLMPVLGEVLGDLKSYERTTPASFANAGIAAAAAATKRKVVLVSGVATEVAVQLACLSALERGYRAQMVVDACGGITARTEDAALRRLVAAGVTTTSVLTLAGELAGDFSQPNGQTAMSILYEMAEG